MEIDQLQLEGIIFRNGKYIACFKGPDGKPYDIQVGQNVYDGQITKISANSVTFKKIMPIVVGGKKEKTVIKYLNPEEERMPPESASCPECGLYNALLNGIIYLVEVPIVGVKSLL